MTFPTKASGVSSAETASRENDGIKHAANAPDIARRLPIDATPPPMNFALFVIDSERINEFKGVSTLQSILPVLLEVKSDFGVALLIVMEKRIQKI